MEPEDWRLTSTERVAKLRREIKELQNCKDFIPERLLHRKATVPQIRSGEARPTRESPTTGTNEKLPIIRGAGAGDQPGSRRRASHYPFKEDLSSFCDCPCVRCPEHGREESLNAIYSLQQTLRAGLERQRETISAPLTAIRVTPRRLCTPQTATAACGGRSHTQATTTHGKEKEDPLIPVPLKTPGRADGSKAGATRNAKNVVGNKKATAKTPDKLPPLQQTNGGKTPSRPKDPSSTDLSDVRSTEDHPDFPTDIILTKLENKGVAGADAVIARYLESIRGERKKPHKPTDWRGRYPWRTEAVRNFRYPTLADQEGMFTSQTSMEVKLALANKLGRKVQLPKVIQERGNIFNDVDLPCAAWLKELIPNPAIYSPNDWICLPWQGNSQEVLKNWAKKKKEMAVKKDSQDDISVQFPGEGEKDLDSTLNTNAPTSTTAATASESQEGDSVAATILRGEHQVSLVQNYESEPGQGHQAADSTSQLKEATDGPGQAGDAPEAYGFQPGQAPHQQKTSVNATSGEEKPKDIMPESKEGATGAESSHRSNVEGNTSERRLRFADTVETQYYTPHEDETHRPWKKVPRRGSLTSKHYQRWLQRTGQLVEHPITKKWVRPIELKDEILKLQKHYLKRFMPPEDWSSDVSHSLSIPPPERPLTKAQEDLYDSMVRVHYALWFNKKSELKRLQARPLREEDEEILTLDQRVDKVLASKIPPGVKLPPYLWAELLEAERQRQAKVMEEENQRPGFVAYPASRRKRIDRLAKPRRPNPPIRPLKQYLYDMKKVNMAVKCMGTKKGFAAVAAEEEAKSKFASLGLARRRVSAGTQGSGKGKSASKKKAKPVSYTKETELRSLTEQEVFREQRRQEARHEYLADMRIKANKALHGQRDDDISRLVTDSLVKGVKKK